MLSQLLMRRFERTAYAALIACSVGTAQAQQPGSAAPMQIAPRYEPAPFSWRILAASSEGRPIEVAQFGTGKRQILIVGPLAGDQPGALGMVDKLAEYLAASRMPLPDVTLTLVRDLNPDGRVRRSRFNVRGVDLDRNFSTTNWQKLPEGNLWRSGPRPHSEAETRVLAALIADLRPERIVAVNSAYDRAGLIWSGPGNDVARALADELGLPLAPPAVQPSGSLGAYAGDERNIPVLAFGVPAGAATLDNWSAYGRGLMTAAGLASPEPRRLPTADLALEPMPGSDAPPTPIANAPREASPGAPAVTPSANPPRGQGPLANGRTRATPISSGRPPEELPRELGAPATPVPSASNSVSDIAESLDLGGWRPASAPPAAVAPGAAADSDKPVYWPATRIQRLPPADRIDGR